MKSFFNSLIVYVSYPAMFIISVWFSEFTFSWSYRVSFVSCEWLKKYSYNCRKSLALAGKSKGLTFSEIYSSKLPFEHFRKIPGNILVVFMLASVE